MEEEDKILFCLHKISKNIKLLLLLSFLLTLTACSEKTVTFIGENDNWMVTVNINNKLKLVEGTYSAEYKGTNLEKLAYKEIGYRVNYKSDSSGGNSILSNEGVLEGTAFNKGCELGCSYTNIDDSELIFTVILDNKEEKIILNNR